MRRLLVMIASAPVYAYRYGVSPFMPMACRFEPTCSAYALEALKAHGPFKGGLLAMRRLVRCHPWGGSGLDPVPGPGREQDANQRKECGHCGP